MRRGEVGDIRFYTQLANALAAWIARRWQTTGGVVLLGAIPGAMVAAVGIAVHWSVR